MRRQQVRRGLVLVVGLAAIVLWQYVFFRHGDPDTTLASPLRLSASNGVAVWQPEFVYFLYYLNLYPVASISTAPREWSVEGARRLIAEQGHTLVMDRYWTIRYGDLAKTYLYLPHVWLKGKPLRPRMLHANALGFTLALLALFAAFWHVRHTTLGAVLVVLMGSNPFQVHEVYANNNLLGWPITITLLMLALHVPLMKNGRPLGRGVLALAVAERAAAGNDASGPDRAHARDGRGGVRVPDGHSAAAPAAPHPRRAARADVRRCVFRMDGLLRREVPAGLRGRQGRRWRRVRRTPPLLSLLLARPVVRPGRLRPRVRSPVVRHHGVQLRLGGPAAAPPLRARGLSAGRRRPVRRVHPGRLLGRGTAVRSDAVRDPGVSRDRPEQGAPGRRPGSPLVRLDPGPSPGAGSSGRARRRAWPSATAGMSRFPDGRCGDTRPSRPPWPCSEGETGSASS